MFRGTILRLLTMGHILRAPDEGGGGPVARPDHIGEDEWEGLSDAEREGLVETDEGEGANQIIGTGEEAEGDEGPDDDLTPEELAAALEGEKPEEETGEPAETTETSTETAAETTETATEVPDEALLAYRPEVSNSELTFTKEVPPEIQTKLDGLDARRDKADEWFDAQENDKGEPFTRADYNKALREIERERETVKDELAEFKIVDRDTQRDNLIWKKSCDAFFSARKDYGDVEKNADGTPVLVDGKPVTTIRSQAMHAALNSQIKRLNSLPGAANKTDMQILVEADKAVREAFGIGKGKPAVAATPAAKPTAKPAAANSKALKEVSDKLLSQVPVAETENTDSMARALSRLSGEKLERALETLSPTQRALLESQV